MEFDYTLYLTSVASDHLSFTRELAESALRMIFKALSDILSFVFLSHFA